MAEHGGELVSLINDRFKSQEDRIRGLEAGRLEDGEEMAALRESNSHLIDAYRALRTALYAVAGSLLVGAVVVVLSGRHL